MFDNFGFCADTWRIKNSTAVRSKMPVDLILTGYSIMMGILHSILDTLL